MRVVIQRVSKACVKIKGETVGKIGPGFLLLVGFTHDDTSSDIDYLVKKIVNMRIFEDENGKMNISLLQKGYQILSVSQFTLFADTRSGNRPGFSAAAKPEIATKLYDEFNAKLREQNVHVETGIFGAEMEVELVNDGPVTIIIDSKKN
ncbi:MAG TPA: D-aminoacyl-tRNA deacylase [Bacilli bacterium]